MKKLGSSILLLLFSIFITKTIAESYDNEFVHQEINENAAKQSEQLLITLKSLGFNNGIDNVIAGKKIYKWFHEGGRLEDETHCRSKYHFHDPLKSWDKAGLSNPVIDTFCFDYTHRSSLLWAQDAGNLWTWQKARHYFYEGLTSSSRDLREQKMADTFRALGQLMHLVADSSVPAHTRNDIHVFPYTVPVIKVNIGDPTYESWTKENYRNLSYTGQVIDQSIFRDAVFHTSAPVAMSALWDQDKYNGINPDITAGNWIGLAEYSNANFFSEDTIFSDYQYPAWSSVEEYNENVHIGKVRTYLKKVKDGEPIAHLAAGKWFYKYVPSWLKSSALVLDERVYMDYAQKLIPRAVGYSAGLLNYFFRGALEISVPEQYVYAIIDGSVIPQQFTQIRAKVRNATADEAIQHGVIQAVAKYKIIGGYSPDLLAYPPDGAVMHNIPFTYSVSAPISITSLSSAEFTEFAFDFTESPIPAGITDLYVHVVFKGTLGNEQDIAVAAGMKDLMEPTHHVFWNLTDMFSLNYHLYTADQIKTTQSLAEEVDLDHDGVFNETGIGEPYIDPYPMTYEISYMAELPFTGMINNVARVDNLPAGRYIRLIVLVDNELSERYVRLTSYGRGDVEPGHDDFIFEGVINQEANGIWQTPTPANLHRHVKQHFYSGVLQCKPLMVDPVTGRHSCSYPDIEAIPADLTPYPVEITVH